MNLQTSKFMTSSSALLHMRKYMFQCFSWILFSIKMKLGEILLSLTTNIPNSFLFWFWRLEPSSRSFLSFQPVLITQQPIIMSFKFLILLKVCTVAIKIINHQLLKVNWRHDINIFLKIINGLKLVYRLQNWTKNMLEMLFISYTNISPSFILILNSIQEKQ